MREAFIDCLRFVLAADPQMAQEAAEPSQETGDLYLDEYWTPIRGDELTPGIDLMVFDAAVMNGAGEAILMLQRVVGKVDPEGQTDRAIQEVNEATLQRGAICMIDDIRRERLAMLAEMHPLFGIKGGAAARIYRARDAAIEMFAKHIGRAIPVRRKTK
jgi:lysozyme family protein